jgi:hypothetical protein
MQTQLFSGTGAPYSTFTLSLPSWLSSHYEKACFSPSVAPTLLRSWGKTIYVHAHISHTSWGHVADRHGGTVARTYQERRTAQYYFCSGASDPWVARYVLSFVPRTPGTDAKYSISVQGLIVTYAHHKASGRLTHAVCRSSTLHGSRAACANSSASPSRRMSLMAPCREEVGTAVQAKKVHGKRLASERLSSSPAVRTPKRARVGSSTGHSDDVDVKREESVPCLDLAAMHRSLESKRRARDG